MSTIAQFTTTVESATAFVGLAGEQSGVCDILTPLAANER